jgi:hypothetical protein
LPFSYPRNSVRFNPDRTLARHGPKRPQKNQGMEKPTSIVEKAHRRRTKAMKKLERTRTHS